MTYGFTFRGTHSSTVGIKLERTRRVIKPAVRPIEYTIPGRDGTIRYEEDTFEKTVIIQPVTISRDSLAQMRAACRALARLVAGVGELIFDDEPDKVYTGATVPDAPDFEELAKFGRAIITFEAQPFAESLTYNEVIDESEDLPFVQELTVTGTQATPPVLYITARAEINDLTIKRQIET